MLLESASTAAVGCRLDRLATLDRTGTDGADRSLLGNGVDNASLDLMQASHVRRSVAFRVEEFVESSVDLCLTGVGGIR